MRRVRAIAVALVVASPGFAADEGTYRLVAYQSFVDVAAFPRKILVVGIADDRQLRNRFEDKFVTHFRGREIAAIASHPLVPSLTKVTDREQVLAAIQAQGVEGVMTVRAVPLDSTGEDRWIESWGEWLDRESTIRQLVDESLPLPAKRAKRYGIEFTLWSAPQGRRLWAGRTQALARKDLEKGVGELLQLAIDGLREARWL